MSVRQAAQQPARGGGLCSLKNAQHHAWRWSGRCEDNTDQGEREAGGGFGRKREAVGQHMHRLSDPRDQTVPRHGWGQDGLLLSGRQPPPSPSPPGPVPCSHGPTGAGRPEPHPQSPGTGVHGCRGQDKAPEPTPSLLAQRLVHGQTPSDVKSASHLCYQRSSPGCGTTVTTVGPTFGACGLCDRPGAPWSVNQGRTHGSHFLTQLTHH